VKIDPATHARIYALRESGMSVRQVADSCKVAFHTAKKCMAKPPPLSAVVPQSPGIKSDKKRGSFNWREWGDELQGLQKLKRKASDSQDQAYIELGDGKAPIILATLSDLHMGSWGCDYAQLRRLTDEILATPNLYVALLGDYGQYSIKLRSVLEVADNIIPPEQQTQFIESWFEEIWPKVAFATWDNHGVERQEKQAGESGLKRILSKRVVYFNGIGHVTLKVGDQLYHGAVSHCFRGRSMYNPVHGLMRYMRFEGTDRDFAMAGDSHVPGMAKYTDGAKVRVAVNSGSIQTNSGYAKRYFSLVTHPVFPVVKFDARERVMTPYWSVTEALAS
jgi:hypothetical protein